MNAACIGAGLSRWSSVVLACRRWYQQKASAAPSRRLPAPTRLMLGWEPIRCWRRIERRRDRDRRDRSRSSLTCAVSKPTTRRSSPDESRLGVASIQMAPFEILGGSHPPDVHRGSRRFFQYRLLSCASSAPMRSASDVNIPAAADLVSHSQPRRRGGDARRPRPVVPDADDADQGAVAGAGDGVGHSRRFGSQPRRGGFAAVSIEPVPGPRR